MLDGILRGQHQKRIGQRVRVIIHGDLRFVHRFQQRGLRLRRGAIDFVGHDDVRENRPGLEFEFLRRGIEDADADYVAGQQVGSELNALERAAEGTSEVLPTPGTSSISKCPRASSVVSASWMTSSLPFTTRVIERKSSARRVLAFVVVVCNSRGLLLQK